MTKDSFRQFYNGLGVALAVFPILILLLFYAYVVRVRLAVGYWPGYSHPESWSMGFGGHYTLLRPWFHVFPLILLPLLSALFNGVLWVAFRRFPKWPFIAFVISACIVYAWRFTDPGRFIDWFLD